MAGKTERFEMRIDEDVLASVDDWRAKQDGVPSRAEAMRRLIEVGLTKTSPATVKFSDGEKLLAVMLADVYRHLNIKGAEVDPEFICQCIFGGHTWAPKWEMQGLFHDHVDNPASVTLVVDVLDMWTCIEDSYDHLTPPEKTLVEDEAGLVGSKVHFAGFDGNNEGELLGIARFLIEKMDRFSRFKARDLNSHHPTEGSLRRMTRVFEGMRASLNYPYRLSADQIIQLLRARHR